MMPEANYSRNALCIIFISAVCSHALSHFSQLYIAGSYYYMNEEMDWERLGNLPSQVEAIQASKWQSTISQPQGWIVELCKGILQICQ